MKHLKALVGTLLAVVILAGCGGTRASAYRYADSWEPPFEFVIPKMTFSDVREPGLADAAMFGAAKTKVRNILLDNSELDFLDWEAFEEIDVKKAGRCVYQDGAEAEATTIVQDGTLYMYKVDDFDEDQIIADMIYHLVGALFSDGSENTLYRVGMTDLWATSVIDSDAVDFDFSNMDTAIAAEVLLASYGEEAIKMVKDGSIFSAVDHDTKAGMGKKLNDAMAVRWARGSSRLSAADVRAATLVEMDILAHLVAQTQKPVESAPFYGSEGAYILDLLLMTAVLEEDLTDAEAQYFAKISGGYLAEVYDEYNARGDTPAVPREPIDAQPQQGLARLSAFKPPISGGLNVVA